MKAKIKDCIYEGTPSEIIELVKLAVAADLMGLGIEEPVKKKEETEHEKYLKVFIPRKKSDNSDNRKFKTWTKKEESDLKVLVNAGGSVYSIAKDLKRTKNSISVRVSKLGLKFSKTEKKIVNGRKYQVDGKGHALAGNWAYIEKRAKSLMLSYKYDYERAREMAMNEWKAARPGMFGVTTVKLQKKTLTTTPATTPAWEKRTLRVDDNFPILPCLSSDSNIILEGMLKNMAKNKYAIKYSDSALPLGMERIGEWYRFVTEFVLKQRELTIWVNKKVGTHGRFIIDGNDRVIRYE